MKALKIISAIMGVLLLLPLCACTNAGQGSNQGAGQGTDNAAVSANANNPTISATIKKDAKFDSADLSIGADDFEQAGFAFGDSCDVEFSNGLTLSDVGYFNGFYVKVGEPVIVAYPNNDYAIIAYNNRDFWSTEGLSDGDTVKITCKEKGKFKTTQDALSQTYSVERSDYSSDEQFSNFRALTGGNLKSNFLFRGASPVDNSRKRASITDSLLKKNNIVDIIDLTDTDEEMQGYFSDENSSSDNANSSSGSAGTGNTNSSSNGAGTGSANSSYTKDLFENGKVIALGMGSNQDSDSFKSSLARGIKHLLNEGGPAYIHCMEGKDRTGFVCMLIEAFAGAAYTQMRDDYMQTYANYYGVTSSSDPDKYNAICSLYFDAFCEYLAGTSSANAGDSTGAGASNEGASNAGTSASDTSALQSFNYAPSAENYLRSCGLTDEELNQLHNMIEN